MKQKKSKIISKFDWIASCTFLIGYFILISTLIFIFAIQFWVMALIILAGPLAAIWNLLEEKWGSYIRITTFKNNKKNKNNKTK